MPRIKRATSKHTTSTLPSAPTAMHIDSTPKETDKVMQALHQLHATTLTLGLAKLDAIPLSDPAWLELACALDKADPLSSFQSEFLIPSMRRGGSDLVPGNENLASLSCNNASTDASSTATTTTTTSTTYFCGNSLGLLPKRTKELVNEELAVWATQGVTGHFNHPHQRPWVSIDATVIAESARLVGAAHASEVAIMNSLTVNLHLLCTTFYHPTPSRFKILMEGGAFPSDCYALQSQVELHGYTAAEAIIELFPRGNEGGVKEYTLRTEDILKVIHEQGNSIALIMLSGVQYYTGQWFEMEAITKAGHEQGCIVGWDLAHAVGNVPLSLHDWGVDFACWCSYKYLNSGPGGIAGCFVHEKHVNVNPAFRGWWGNKEETRFQMHSSFDPIAGANQYRLSNPHVLATVSLLGSLSLFAQTSMSALRAKSMALTAFLEACLDTLASRRVGIITPRDPRQRGAQLSLLFEEGWMVRVMTRLEEAGIICDERRPDVIRIAPAPLYNTFTQVLQCVRVIERALNEEA